MKKTTGSATSYTGWCQRCWFCAASFRYGTDLFVFHVSGHALYISGEVVPSLHKPHCKMGHLKIFFDSTVCFWKPTVFTLLFQPSSVHLLLIFRTLMFATIVTEYFLLQESIRHALHEVPKWKEHPRTGRNLHWHTHAVGDSKTQQADVNVTPLLLRTRRVADDVLTVHVNARPALLI